MFNERISQPITYSNLNYYSEKDLEPIELPTSKVRGFEEPKMNDLTYFAISISLIVIVIIIIIVILNVYAIPHELKKPKKEQFNDEYVLNNIMPTGMPKTLPELSRITPQMKGTVKKYPPMLGQTSRYGIETAYTNELSCDPTKGVIHRELNVYSPNRSDYNPRIWNEPYYPPNRYHNTVQSINVVYPTEKEERDSKTIPVKIFSPIR
jgi:hypothetical protein